VTKRELQAELTGWRRPGGSGDKIILRAEVSSGLAAAVGRDVEVDLSHIPLPMLDNLISQLMLLHGRRSEAEAQLNAQP
jgi:hypothetical protein